MAKYESSVKQVNAPVERVYAVLSDLERLRPMIEMAQNNEMIKQKLREAGQDPAQLEKLKDMTITSDGKPFDFLVYLKILFPEFHRFFIQFT